MSVSERTGHGCSFILVPELNGDWRDLFGSVFEGDLLEMSFSTLEVVF